MNLGNSEIKTGRAHKTTHLLLIKVKRKAFAHSQEKHKLKPREEPSLNASAGKTPSPTVHPADGWLWLAGWLNQPYSVQRLSTGPAVYETMDQKHTGTVCSDESRLQL